MPVVIPSLNHIFEPLTPPLARKFAPVTTTTYRAGRIANDVCIVKTAALILYK
jgi:hypothetical protein